jgi:uncharacterized protein YqgV (UPF0045/DUF77 family)
MKLIGQAHSLIHQNGVARIQSDIRVGTRYPSIITPKSSERSNAGSRTDKKQHFSEKVTKVESILAADGKVEKKIVEAKPAVSDEHPKKAAEEAVESKEAKPVEARQPLTPGTNKGTWASMFKK